MYVRARASHQTCAYKKNDIYKKQPGRAKDI